MPPLRERKEDLVTLVNYLLKRLDDKYQKNVAHVPPEMMAAFANYHWPGNIRELENVLERMVLMAETGTLGLDQLPSEIRGKVSIIEPSTLRGKVDNLTRLTEKEMIIDALTKTNQNRTKAARLLGISRRTLQNKIKEYGL